jgi:DNA invertase Pin-like site-specific DNA recombinase
MLSNRTPVESRDDRVEAVEVTTVVVVYERVSSEKQDIARQARQRERAAADYPDAELRVIQDDGVSAFKVSIFDRPGGAELCDLITTAQVEAIYVDAQDRLSRGGDLEWVTFRTLCEERGTRIVVDGQALTDDLGGNVMGYLRNILARQESAEKSHRVTTGKAAKARQGRSNGGPRRYGFEARMDSDGRLVPIPAEVAVVERIFREVAAGEAQAVIAKRLNADGYRTAEGRAWTQSPIGHLIRNPVWVGELRGAHGTFNAGHGEVIPRELWDKVQAMRVPRGERARGRNSERFLMGNRMLRCGRCGSTMRVVRKPNKDGSWYEAYRCHGRDSGGTGCDMPAVKRTVVDVDVLDYFARSALDVDGTIAQLAEARDKQLRDVHTRAEHARSVIAKAERQLEVLDIKLRDEGLSVDEWRALKAVPQREVEAATLALHDLASEEQSVRDQDADLNATAEVVEVIAQMRAQVAGEIADAVDLRAAQTAIRRVFEYVVLHQFDGKAWLDPVLNDDMVANPTSCAWEGAEPKPVAIEFRPDGLALTV